VREQVPAEGETYVGRYSDKNALKSPRHIGATVKVGSVVGKITDYRSLKASTEKLYKSPSGMTRWPYVRVALTIEGVEGEVFARDTTLVEDVPGLSCGCSVHGMCKDHRGKITLMALAELERKFDAHMRDVFKQG